MGTVKASGTLSLEDDVLPNLPAAAPSDGGATIGSNAVSMSDFYDSVAGGVPSSGEISFSDFYNVNNQYAVANFTYNTVISSTDGKGNSPQGLRSTSVTGRVGYRYGNRSTNTTYTQGALRSTDTSGGKGNSFSNTAFSQSATRSTNTLATHYTTYS